MTFQEKPIFTGSMTTKRPLHTNGSLDERTFEQMFREFFPALMAFARKFLSDEDDAREVVHNVFINLWERRESMDLSTSLKSYLFTSVHNRCLNQLRDRKKFSSDEVPEVVSGASLDQHMEAMELEKKIGEVIAQLPEKCREIFELNRFKGYSYGEIAQRLGISVKTVENQMSKALRVLRERLVDYLGIVVWVVVHGLS